MDRAPWKVAAWILLLVAHVPPGEGRRKKPLCNLVSQSRHCPRGLLIKPGLHIRVLDGGWEEGHARTSDP